MPRQHLAMVERRAGNATRIARQLRGVGRRIDADLKEIVTTQSRWIIDLTRSRFQRCALDQDHVQAIAFGSWTDLTDARVDDGRFLVVEPEREHPVRAEIREETLDARDRDAPLL